MKEFAVREDARRNHARILAVAQAEVAAHGATASLEQIARTAGVGSATVRRHFPTRRALLEAVSHERIETLRLRAQDLAAAPDPRPALLSWLADLLDYSLTARGLAPALAEGTDPVQASGCAAVLGEAVNPLLAKAIGAGAVTAEVTVTDLITLVVGIVMAVEHRADPVAEATRLLGIAVAGLSPPTRT
jgi:AcrR family transcriptional regulator